MEINPAEPVNPETLESTADPKKVSIRNLREYAIIGSDRIALVDGANDFVRQMKEKQFLSYCALGIPDETCLTSEEDRTYKAALDFLYRQFEIGVKEPEPQQTRAELEQSVEYQ